MLELLHKAAYPNCILHTVDQKVLCWLRNYVRFAENLPFS